MAIQAETHGKSFRLIRERHRFDIPVATFATHPFGNVNTVIEVDVVREIRNLVPDDRRIIGKALADRGQQRGIVPNLRMTGHARISRR
jgi:hypothetical protein